MKKIKLNLDGEVLEKISTSSVLTQWEKLNFLKFVWYLTKKEQKDLVALV